MSACALEKFVNRDKERRFVLDRVSQLARGRPFSPKERVIHFVGPSGIGKSCLLEKCYQELIAARCCVPLFVQLDTLKGGKRGFTDELLVTVYRAFCSHRSIAVQAYDGKNRSQFVRHVHRTINFHGRDQVIVLLLDEINIPSKTDMQEIEDHLLEKFLHDNDRAVLIMAGRSHPMFYDFALTPNVANTFLLPVFDQERIGEQVEYLSPGSGTLAEKLMKLGSGVPGNTVNLVKHVVGSPPDIPNELQAVQSLLDEVKSRNKIESQFHPMIEAICILQAFHPEDVTQLFQNHPGLGAEWDEDQINAVFIQLRQVQVGPGGVINWDKEKKSWVMDESMRGLFELELKMRDPELWRKLHCTARDMYQKWAEEYNSDTFREKSAYHHKCLQSAGMNCNDMEG